MRDEREILTRQIISKKLIYEAKRSMVGALLISILCAIIFGMINLSLLSAHYVSPITKLAVNLLQLPVYAVCVFFFVRAIINICKTNKGAFTVTEEELVSVKDNEFSLLQLVLYGGLDIISGNKSHLRHVFEFKSGKKFVANVEEYKNTRLGVTAQFSMPGDTFFIVCYNDAPSKIILLFSSKTYTYKNNG
jgi:hypothetical protein